MKNLILFFFALTSFTAVAQSRLAELYNLNPGDHYPANMPRVKQWINTTLGPVFIRNLQFSDNTRSSSKFISFNPVSRPGASWMFAGMDGVKLFPNFSSVNGQYDQEILSYLRAFDITTFDYQHRSYFLMAKNILRITDDQLLANTLNFFTESGPKNRYQQLIDQVNKVKKLKLTYPATDNVHALADILEKQFPGKIADVLFDCYITGKNNDETMRNMQRFYQITGFYQKGVESRIDELMNPKIQVKQDKSPILQLPLTALKLSGKSDSLARFSIETFTAVLNYHKQQLEVIFKGKMNGEADASALKVINYDYKTGKTTLSKLPPSTPSQAITELRLTVGENGVTLIGVSADYGRYMMIDQAWKP